VNLTAEQIDALVEYALSTLEGSYHRGGQELFSQNCTVCHGEFGEGGINPSNSNDIIFPISTTEYLQTRDDITISSIISQGQPNSGMSPFGSSNGGPLDDDQINAIVAYMRSWEANPPVELPPDISAEALSFSGSEIYANICAQCHGLTGEGGVGPAFADDQFQQSTSDEDIFNAISQGHPGTSMIAWAGVLSNEQIQSLIDYIRQMPPVESETDTPPDTNNIPTFERLFCHL
jgi:mono/diheme cytochrome c family protein